MNVNFLNKLMDTASDITMPYFKSNNFNIESKQDGSPVTIADKESELALRKLINEAYPDHGILGEEFGSENADAQYVWIIDPIDGTKAFVSQIDTFANMVGLLKNGVPIMSAIGFPAKGERFIGIGGVAYLNGEIITASTANLSDCDVCFCGSYMFDEQETKQVENVIASSGGTIVEGDAYNYCRMACGDSRIIIESDLQAYDFLPLVPIVNGAGGRVTDWAGDILTMDSSMQVISGGTAYDSAIKLLNS